MKKQLRNLEENEQLRREKEILEPQGFEFDGHSWVQKMKTIYKKEADILDASFVFYIAVFFTIILVLW